MELAESLTEADLDALRSDCETLGLNGWARWFDDNLDLVLDFVQATPSARRKKNSWQEPVLFRRLTLGAAYHVKLAGAMLRSADLLSYREGISDREMARTAGQECYDLVPEMLRRWPFEDPNPFA